MSDGRCDHTSRPCFKEDVLLCLVLHGMSLCHSFVVEGSMHPTLRLSDDLIVGLSRRLADATTRNAAEEQLRQSFASNPAQHLL